METLFETSSQFPTVIFSVVLGIIVVYWIIGLLGLVDLDFSGDFEADLDIDTDIDGDINASLGSLSGLLLTFGLTGIPFTLVISIISLICWLISFYLHYYLFTLLPSGWLYYLAGFAATVIIFFISLPITAIIIRPLKGMFKSAETATSHHLVGKEAIIATSTVSDTFGQARVFNDGAEILLDVRCDQALELKAGAKVLLIEYSTEKHIFWVAPYTQ